MTNKIEVQSSSGIYDVTIGSGILEDELTASLSEYESDTAFVIIDENVKKNHDDNISGILDNLFTNIYQLTVPEGESSKSISFWSICIDFLLENGARRNTPIFVFGGGVTGDVGGFAAASALRGIPLIHIPTSLLAMVDSSIGGKTGINHQIGKNLIGAFYQPKKVIADIDFLQTLPNKEWVNGLSEILKYGAIRDESIFEDADLFLSEDFKNRDSKKLVQLISKCVKVKADIVREDEFEGGIRAYLNFGHTFAHALEKACGYEKMSHGEAVYLGMLAACKLSKMIGGDLDDNKIRKFRPLYHYRVSKEELSFKELMEYMKSDKKRTDQHIRFVLLQTWQHPILKSVSDNTLIRQAWDDIFTEL